VANELRGLIDFLNERYAVDAFNQVRFGDVRRLAATCITGCSIVEPGLVAAVADGPGMRSALVQRALHGSPKQDVSSP
jgi:hypothetical protein